LFRIDGVIRLLAIVTGLLLLGAGIVSPVVRAQPIEIPRVVIRGESLAHEVALAPADADEFRRRVSQPPRLDDAPGASGDSYEVITPYWDSAIQRKGEEDEDDDLRASEEATYYPEGGYVRADLAGTAVWMVLDIRQQAILNRYLGLARDDRIGPAPSTFEVLAASIEADSNTEAGASFSLEAGVQVVEPATAGALVAKIAAANPSPLLQPFQQPQETSGGYWLTLFLPEGRSLQYYFDGRKLTDWLGTEQYDASTASAELTELAPTSLPVIDDDPVEGSRVWWVIAGGGGLVVIGLAVWLSRRRSAKAE
jgi:hypothetical protein